MKSLQDISKVFGLLVPEKLDGGLLIITLNRKIKEEILNEEFTRQDIQDILEEIAQLENKPAPQTERILKLLIPFFLKRPPEKAGKYYLSEYAKDFVRLIELKLESPFRDFPLKKNFEKYFSFKASDITTINDFEEWYHQNFIGSSRKVISEHLESLQDELDKAIQQLNEILHSDELSALEMAKEFAMIFQDLGEKQEQITDALFYKDSIVGELKLAVVSFYTRIETSKHHQTNAEKDEFNQLQIEWQRAEVIEREVKEFFRIVDKRLGQINSQIVYSSNKLSELQENFKSQSRFKINLRKMLEILLRESQYGKESLTLPKNFPRKRMPFEQTKFFGVPYYDFSLTTQNQPIEEEQDIEYEEAQRASIEYEMERQLRITKWIEELKTQLTKEGEIVWSDKFFEILDQEQDVEIPLQVGFELIQGIQTNTKQTIEIKQSLQLGSDTSDFALWNMKIKAQ